MSVAAAGLRSFGDPINDRTTTILNAYKVTNGAAIETDAPDPGQPQPPVYAASCKGTVTINLAVMAATSDHRRLLTPLRPGMVDPLFAPS